MKNRPLTHEEISRFVEDLKRYIPVTEKSWDYIEQCEATLKEAAAEAYNPRELANPATISTYRSGGGITARAEMADADYLILHKTGEKQGECIDISYRERIIRLYQDEPWRIHPMNRNSQTNSITIVDNS